MGFILVLGATGAIGSATARRLHASGQQVLLAGRDADKLKVLAAELSSPWALIDLADTASIDAAVAVAVEGGGLTGAVNCIGSLVLKAAHHTRDAELHDLWLTHVVSSFALVRAAVKVLPPGGSIVLVSSAAARIGLANHEAIAAAKGAVEGLTLSAAATYASRKLRVNAVAPGLVRAGMTERIVTNAAALASSLAMHPLGRIGEPDDVAAAICFLLSDSASFITGQILGVDGGLADLKVRAG